MADVLEQVSAWLRAGERVATGTVVRVERSAPRDPGAVMAVNGRGEVAGSVSGGCVEGALYDELRRVLAGAPPRVVTYGIADDEAFEVGLTCGGTIHVLLDRADPALLDRLEPALREGRPAALVTTLTGPRVGAKLLVAEGETFGTLGGPELDAAAEREALRLLAHGITGVYKVEDVDVFVRSFAPPPRLFVFGGVAFAAAVARLGKFLGYHVVVCDARATFATRERFPDADEVLVEWPHEVIARVRPGPRDAVCVLTHDPKFDIPGLRAALATEAGYIGALGSRKTIERRTAELRELGVNDADLARISAPIGLDVGARSPEETAVAILAEVIAVRNGKAGGRLRASAGRIHAR